MTRLVVFYLLLGVVGCALMTLLCGLSLAITQGVV